MLDRPNGPLKLGLRNICLKFNKQRILILFFKNISGELVIHDHLVKVLSVSCSSLCLGWAAACDCGTPWTFLLPFCLVHDIDPRWGLWSKARTSMKCFFLFFFFYYFVRHRTTF